MAVLAQWCVRFTFRDAKGQTRSVTVCFQTDGTNNAANAAQLLDGVQSLQIALAACTNAHVQSEANVFGAGATQSGVTWGATGDYQSVSQQARLYWVTADPSGDPAPAGTLTIPAPLATGGDHGNGIFLADRVTVDPNCTQILALVAQVNPGSTATNPVVCTRSGLLYTTFVGGKFLGRPITRKFNKYTFDGTLTVRGV